MSTTGYYGMYSRYVACATTFRGRRNAPHTAPQRVAARSIACARVLLLARSLGGGTRMQQEAGLRRDVVKLAL